MEHENLISDSEYITLSHQTDDATTHIQTAALKEQLDGLHNYLQQLEETISSIGGLTISTRYYPAELEGVDYSAFKQVVTNGNNTFVTYTFNVNSGNPQLTLVPDLKNDLEKFVRVDSTVSNGAISLTNDGTSIKLINNKSTESGMQQGTFTFFDGIILN